MFRDKDSLNREEKKIWQRASDWLAARDEGLDPAEESKFQEWKSEDIRHELAVRQLEETWVRMKQLAYLVDDPGLRPNFDILSSSNRLRRRNRKTLVRVVASLAAVAVLSFGLWLTTEFKAGTPTPDFYSTTFNDYKKVTLEDGSIVEINANTRIEIVFTKEARKIHLHRGEAHFQVKKDAARPFFVDAGLISVKAVGTAFNVRYGQEEIQVLVTEGRVSVNNARDISEFGKHADHSPILPELVAGDQTTISTKTNHIVPLVSKVKSEEYEEILAWKGPRLFFNATPLEEAVEQFNEHNSMQVTLVGEELKKLSIGGSFLVEDVEAFIRLLTGDGSISAERNHPDEIVLKSTN